MSRVTSCFYLHTTLLVPLISPLHFNLHNGCRCSVGFQCILLRVTQCVADYLQTWPATTPPIPTYLLGLSSRSSLFSFPLNLGGPCDLLWPKEWNGNNTSPSFMKHWSLYSHSLGSPETPCKGAHVPYWKGKPYGEKSAWPSLDIPATPAGASNMWVKLAEIVQPRWAIPANTIWSRDELLPPNPAQTGESLAKI